MHSEEILLKWRGMVLIRSAVGEVVPECGWKKTPIRELTKLGQRKHQKQAPTALR